MIRFYRSENLITYKDKGWECHSDFFSKNGEHEALPDGEYVCHADEPPAENNESYGTFYISTGDPRGRDIHGGGSDLEDPFADYQGWEPTYGCLRMQNADGQALSRMILDDGNDIPFTVYS